MAANKKVSNAVATKNNTPTAETKKVETAAPVKTEAKAEKKPEVKTETKPVEKPAAVKAAEPKKAPAPKKKTTRTAKKGAKRGPKPASERTVELYVQFGDKEVAYTDLVNQIKTMWKDQGKRETSLKVLNIYVKPEESKAYYVINAGTKGEVTGEIDF